MAEKTFVQLPTLPAGQLQGGDIFAVVDVSDATSSPQGTSKQITAAALFTNPVVTGPLSATGRITTTDETDATTTSDGSVQTDGGLSVVKSGVFGSKVTAAALQLTDATSVLVGGATSFAIRNAANTTNNVLVTDAGNVAVLQQLSAKALKGTGTSPTPSVQSGNITSTSMAGGSTDLSGSVLASKSGDYADSVIRITFAVAKTAAPFVILSSRLANQVGVLPASLGIGAAYYITATTTYFEFGLPATSFGIGAGTVSSLVNYIVIDQ